MVGFSYVGVSEMLACLRYLMYRGAHKKEPIIFGPVGGHLFVRKASPSAAKGSRIYVWYGHPQIRGTLN